MRFFFRTSARLALRLTAGCQFNDLDNRVATSLREGYPQSQINIDKLVGLVRAALGEQDGRMLNLFKKAGIDKVAVAGLSFDVGKVGLGTGVTLSAALTSLSDCLKCPIVLVIDEVQHAVTKTPKVPSTSTSPMCRAPSSPCKARRSYGVRRMASTR